VSDKWSFFILFAHHINSRSTKQTVTRRDKRRITGKSTLLLVTLLDID
jgi:hypothetical protein